MVGIPTSGHHRGVVRTPLLSQTSDRDRREDTPVMSQPMYAGRWVAGSARVSPAVSYDTLRTELFEHEPLVQTSRCLCLCHGENYSNRSA